jgi:Na+-driven multidrug efflux pump
MSKLVNESVTKTIFRMAIPMLAGTFAITMYNLTNAGFMITGAHYPVKASLLNILRVVVLLIPLSIAGSIL